MARFLFQKVEFALNLLLSKMCVSYLQVCLSPLKRRNQKITVFFFQQHTCGTITFDISLD
jgi:hypothetical protein